MTSKRNFGSKSSGRFWSLLSPSFRIEICFFPCVLIFEGSAHNFGIFWIGGLLPPTWSLRGSSTPRATKTSKFGFKVHFTLLYQLALEYLESEVPNLQHDLRDVLILPELLGRHNSAERYIL